MNVIDRADKITAGVRAEKAARAAGISERPKNTGYSSHPATCPCGKPAGYGRGQALCTVCAWDEDERANRALPPELQRD